MLARTVCELHLYDCTGQGNKVPVKGIKKERRKNVSNIYHEDKTVNTMVFTVSSEIPF